LKEKPINNYENGKWEYRKELFPLVYIQTKCPLCSSSDLKPICSGRNNFPGWVAPVIQKYHHSWIQLLECNECHFAFTKEMPADDDFFNKRYDIPFDVNTEQDNEFKNHFLKRFADRLEYYGKSSSKLLDIGSFAGVWLRYAKERGHQVEGIEVNPTMAKLATDKFNIKVFNGSVWDFPASAESFDVITMIDVLEHLWEPMIILKKCHSLLRPGGILLIKVPHYRPQLFKQKIAQFFKISQFGIFENYGHVNHFSPASLGRALEELDFEILEDLVVESEVFAGKSLIHLIKNLFRKTVSSFSFLIKFITRKNMALNFALIAKKN